MTGETPLRSNDEPDDSLDPVVRAAAAAYHEPPTVVPREAMWGAIQQARGRNHFDRVADAPDRTPVAVGPRRQWHRWSQPMLAAAATLLIALGVSLGWWMRGGGRGSPNLGLPRAQVTAIGANDPAYRIAVTGNLTQAEALLTAFRDKGRSRDAEAGAQLAQWAREVLANTQLLLDSPAGADPQRRQLLEDLELVLVQMTQPGSDQTSTDREMIDRTLEHGHVLSRIRAAVPAGSAGT